MESLENPVADPLGVLIAGSGQQNGELAHRALAEQVAPAKIQSYLLGQLPHDPIHGASGEGLLRTGGQVHQHHMGSLTAAGHGTAGSKAQNPEVIAIMKHAFSTIPGILWIVTAIVLFFYRLNKKRYNEIVEDLKKGKSHSNNA